MKLNIREIAIFGMLGALMFASKILCEALPNIHLLGMMIVTVALVFRAKALYPLYIFVLISGVFYGFSTWWLPYLYIWTVLWALTMLIPDNKLPEKAKPFVYGFVCGLHGILYGVLYAPAQALLFGLNFDGMLAWIVAGFPFDAIHGLSNLIVGLVLIYPLSKVLKRLNENIIRKKPEQYGTVK